MNMISFGTSFVIASDKIIMGYARTNVNGFGTSSVIASDKNIVGYARTK
jgi:hypothetical protein